MNITTDFWILIVECIKYIVSTLLMILRYAAWPIMIVFIAIHYKGIFENVLKRATRLGWGNAEIEFREALDDLDGQSDKNDGVDYLIKSSPNWAVISSFKDFELICEEKGTEITNRILDKQSPNSESNHRVFHRPGAIFMQLLPILKEMDVFSALDIEAVSTLRKLRNNVAHSAMEVTENDAKRYVDQCAELTKKIDSFKIDDHTFDKIYEFIKSDERLSRFWQVKTMD